MNLAPTKSRPCVCPNCSSVSVYRSRRRGLAEFLLHRVAFISPYRCSECDFRHFRFRLTQSPTAHLPLKPQQF